MIFKKRVLFYIVFVILPYFANSQTVDSLYKVGTWYDFKQSAVSFTFDDNTPNQISVALPLFDQYDYKMTFFPVINWGPNWTALKTAAQNGHEIASHTVSHTDLSTLTNDQQINEFKNSQDAINAQIDGEQCLTIAYPYCISGISSITEKYYIAARGCSGSIVSKTPSNFMNISSFVCGSQGSIQRSSDFSDKAKSAVRLQGWTVFLIHAVDDEAGYSPTSSAELGKALQFFTENEETYWLTTFSNTVRYIKQRNSVSVNQIAHEDSVITLSVSDTMDNAIYNLPVSIRRQLPQGWSSARVLQNGKIVESTIVNVDELDYLSFNVVPDSGEIKIVKQEITDISQSILNTVVGPHLMQNYPNPFNPVTTIRYSVPRSAHVSIKVYDILGKEITKLYQGIRQAGNFVVRFDGSILASGVYFYRMETDHFIQTRKLVLFK